jgi:hypothetical protein
MSFFTPFAFVKSPASAFDADAQAFFNRVTAAGGTLSGTEQTAVNQLVLDLKAYNIWTPIKALYPIVGASAAACAQNLKSSSFTGTFNGGWTFASTGVTPNGTTGYFDTTLVPNTSLTFNNVSYAVYSRSNFTPSGPDHSFGCSSQPSFLPIIGQSFTSTKRITTYIYSFNSPDVMQSATGQNFAAMFISTRTSATSAKFFRNTTSLASVTSNNQVAQPNNNWYFGALNLNGTAGQYMNSSQALWSIADGFNDTECSNFYTSVQTFQTTLGRQV